MFKKGVALNYNSKLTHPLDVVARPLRLGTEKPPIMAVFSFLLISHYANHNLLGHVISPASTGCSQAGAITCSYTPSTPFPNGQAVWMIRAEYTGPDSALASFNVKTGSSTPLPNICQQGSAPVSGQIQAGTAICIAQDGSGQAQLHIFVENNQVGKTLLIRTAHGSGEGSILFKRSNRPSLTSYELSSNNPGIQDTLSVPNIQSGWNYIHFSSATSFSGVTLLAQYQ